MAWYKNRAQPLFKWNGEGIAQVIPHKNDVHAHVISGRTNQARFENNTFILILQHFQK